MHVLSPRGSRTCLAVVALLSLLGACGSGADDNEATGTPSSAGGPVDLRSVCPSTIVVQTSWFPDPVAAGALYQMLGPNPVIDAQKQRVTAPLMAQGNDTGVKLEVRAGGPAIGLTSTTAQMYLDPSITLSLIHLDQQIQQSATQPTVGVAALLEKDPLIILWDPATYPEFQTIKDIGRTNTTVVYYGGSTSMEYLVGSGQLKRSQVDGSYDGSPARFVASGGEIAQDGYATVDPYTYEHDVKAWGKPVKFQLVYDTGYPNYGEGLAIRAGEKAKLTPCLRTLIPIVQQAQVDVLNDPEQTIDLTLKLDKAYNARVLYTEGSGEFGINQAKTLGLIGNGSDSTLGNYDDARVQRLIDITKPIFAAQKKPIKEGLKPSDVVTNEFIDPKIGVGSDQ
jgi:hypothetical protein